MKRNVTLVMVLTALLFVSCKDNDDDFYGLSNGQLTEITGSAIYQPKELGAAIVNGGYFTIPSSMSSSVPSSISSWAQNNIKSAVDLMVYQHVPQMDLLFLKEVGLGNNGSRQWQVESYVFNYKSTSASGEPVILSGRVTFPNNTVADKDHDVRTLSIYNHFVLGSHSNAPSLMLSPLTIRSLYNSAVIESDYEGYGVSADRPHCGSSFAALAQQIADCTTAAIEVMKQHGVKLADNGYSTNWGYSLGGPPTLAFARYYDTQASDGFKNAVRLKSTFTGGGPFCIDKMIEYMDKHLDYSASLANTMLKHLRALKTTQTGGYEVKDYSPDWMQTYHVTIGGKEYPLLDAWDYGFCLLDSIPAQYGYDGNLLRCCFASGMCTADGHLDYTNDKTKALMNVFTELSNWDGWSPQTDIYMTHCVEDDLMPYEQAKELFTSLKGKSGNVYCADTHSGIFSPVAGTHIEASAIALLNMIQYEEPKYIYYKYK